MHTEREQKIKDLLQALDPTVLELIDDSAQHIGHAGAQGGASHYTVVIASPQFEDKPLLACHRMIYKVLDDMIPTEIHALRIKIQR